MSMPIVPPFAVKASYQTRQYDQDYDINNPYGASSKTGPTVSPLSALVTPPTSAVDAQAAAEAVGYNVGFTAYTDQSQVEQVTINGAPTGGSFMLSLGGDTTSALAYNATAAQVQAALLALPSVPAAVPTPVIQTVAITGFPTGGTFTLTYSGQTTGALAFNADAATVQAALRKLSTIPKGTVAVTAPIDEAASQPPAGEDAPAQPGGPYTITFQGSLEYTATAITASGSGLTGGSTPAVTVTATQSGSSSNVNALSVAVASGGNAGGGAAAGGPWVVTYGGPLAHLWLEPSWEPFLVADGGALTGGTRTSVSVAIAKQGHPAFQNWPIKHANEQYDKLRNEWDYGCGNNFAGA